MNVDIKDFAPIGTKYCEGKCDRKRIIIDESIKIICLGCKRVVMEV